MQKLSYLVKRLGDMNYGAMWDTVKQLREVSGKSTLGIVLDMAQCAVRYGAGYMDYQLFEMYRLCPNQRDTYLTRGRNNALVRQYNDPAWCHVFDNKAEFYANFDRFLHRDWLLLGETSEEEVDRFVSSHPVMFAKPTDGCCGRGVRKITREEFPEVRKELGENTLLETAVKQHPDLNRLYPTAINTARIVTIYKDGVSHVIAAYLRIGNHGNTVDNFNHGGMTAPIDLETGKVREVAVDKKKMVYREHPMTGCPIKGFQLPNWEAALKLASEAAAVVPQMGYIGWDIAFSENGPLIIEGNNFPGHDIYQLPAQTPDGIGVYPSFQV